MDNKFESANLILKLYELRREEVMRQARDWFSAFFPESAQELMAANAGPQNSYLRMVISYWDMACSLVNNGAIDEIMFNDANGEHIYVFSKVQPYLAEVREAYKLPDFLRNLETLVMRRPNALEILTQARERSKAAATARRAAAKQ